MGIRDIRENKTIKTSEVINDHVRSGKLCLHTDRLHLDKFFNRVEQAVVWVVLAAASMILLQAFRGWI
jgi:hypothetical protein